MLLTFMQKLKRFLLLLSIIIYLMQMEHTFIHIIPIDFHIRR